MKRTLFFLLVAVISGFCQVRGDENQNTSGAEWQAGLYPALMGFRFDDNVYQSIFMEDRLSDEIYSLNWGGDLTGHYGLIKLKCDYHLGVDQYLVNTPLNNYKNDFDLLVAAEPEDFSFYYKGEYFIRDSQYYYFNYFETNNAFGAVWAPKGPWTCEAQGRYFTRQYYDGGNAPYVYADSGNQPVTGQLSIQALDYVDQTAFLSIQRELDDKFSLKLEGSYNDRIFNRNRVMQNEDGTLVSLPSFPLQADETWTLRLSAHFYFESILQEITVEQQRTNSNSFGFSNSVQSASWAASIQPFSSFYLQMLVRFYSKVYDTNPLTYPDLQIGYVDEDSQDLLSLRANWEWSPQWTAGLSIGRVRTESLQPGEFYIKDVLSAQIQRNF